MRAQSIITINLESDSMNRPMQMHSPAPADEALIMHLASSGLDSAVQVHRRFPGRPVSCWSVSSGKRVFDCACVLLTLPLLLPVLILTALAVRFTSAGPILFLQKRMGRHGRTFTILKFRSMAHDLDKGHHAVTTANNQRFTPVGPFLRRSKLDELPQLLNVLAGHMSLVGPRPKMPEHVVSELPCRPGITGAATIAFAQEELLLERVPSQSLNDFYHSVVLPAKNQLDASYMAQATCGSDLQIIIDSILRRWDSVTAENLLNVLEYEAADKKRRSRVHAAGLSHPHAPIPSSVDRPVGAEQLSGF